MLSVKKGLSMLLVLALVLTLVPVMPIQATGQGSLELETPVVVEMNHKNATSSIPSGPSLASGNHAQWIDRIANLPTYASNFYNWLVSNATATGALADPTKATLRNDAYVYHLSTITASVDFTYASSATVGDAARQAARNHGSQNFNTVMGYTVEAYSAFHRDHPEVFWLNGRSSYTWTMSIDYKYSGGTGTATYTMRVFFYLQSSDFDLRYPVYYDTSAIAADIAQRDSDVARILANCPDSSAYEQLRYLNKTLTESNCYNLSANSSVSMLPWMCLSALGGTNSAEGPVCEGYAKAFKVLCDQLDIPCVLVEGDARSQPAQSAEPHMWNYVQVDHDWYAVDVTWNDPLVSGTNSTVSGRENENWFLLGADSEVADNFTFLQSHPVTNVVTSGGLDFSNGPVLKSDAYVFQSNYMDVAPYRSAGTYTAPVREGKLFAGWFTDAAMTKPLDAKVISGYAYAKFVDAQTLTVKYQLTGSTTSTSASTNLRFLTAVSGLNLSWVSFDTSINGGAPRSLRSTHVFEQVKVNGKVTGHASKYFGPDAAYYAAYTITGVPNAAFDSQFSVTPSWKTLDGTVVMGTNRVFTIRQGL